MRTQRAATAALLTFALAISGCAAPRKIKPSPVDTKPSAPADSANPNFAPGVDATEASLRGSQFQAVPDLETIYFDYDSATLSDDALSVLKKNAVFLKSHRQLEVRVAGYCDERGTIEYNLALGQKRAKEVREYYIRLGVPGQSVATISYGKEQPVCTESTEECWGQNRRAETRVRAPAPAAEADAGGASGR